MKNAQDMARDLKSALGGRNEGATSAYWTEVFVAMGNPPAARRAPAPPASSGSIKPAPQPRPRSSAAPPPRPKKRTTSSKPPAATAEVAREERQAGTDAWLHAHNQLEAARQRGSKKDIAHWSKTLDKISKANVARLARQEEEFKRETATRVARGKDAVSRPVAEMAEDFRLARMEADQAVARKSDTGSFNFDYPTIRAERSAAKVAKALKIGGLDSHRGSGMWKGHLLISPPAGTGSQGRRNAWAEAMTKALEARGYFAATYYKMD